MKKLFYIMIIALTIGCQKEQCEEIVTNVELGVTYTASSDGVLTVNNPAHCIAYISIDKSENKGTYNTLQEHNINAGSTYIVKQLTILHSTPDTIWYETCSSPITATFKNKCIND